MKRPRSSIVAAGLAVLIGLAPAGCGGSDDEGDSSSALILGSSLPLSGPLAPFGGLLKAGYQEAVANANKGGGLDVGGTKRQVELVVRDNESDPTVATQQARALIQEERAAALLGSATPQLNIPISSVADSLRVPLVLTGTPLQAWLGATEKGWTYSWDFFWDEADSTDLQFEVSDLTPTNKKIALFTDNEQDGQVMGKLWVEKAPDFGYDIVSHARFPVGTTDYGSFISDAKSAKAEIVIAQMLPPDGIALWKQMKALGFQPKLAFCEKCSNNAGWGKALRDVAVGTSEVGYWSQSLGYPGTEDLVKKYGEQTGNTDDLSAVAFGQSVAEVALDAIRAAGSTDANEINSALARTDGDYVAGHIEFGSNHTAVMPTYVKQWTSPLEQEIVFPTADAQTKLVAPVTGLE